MVSIRKYKTVKCGSRITNFILPSKDKWWHYVTIGLANNCLPRFQKRNIVRGFLPTKIHTLHWQVYDEYFSQQLFVDFFSQKCPYCAIKMKMIFITEDDLIQKLGNYDLLFNDPYSEQWRLRYPVLMQDDRSKSLESQLHFCQLELCLYDHQRFMSSIWYQLLNQYSRFLCIMISHMMKWEYFLYPIWTHF